VENDKPDSDYRDKLCVCVCVCVYVGFPIEFITVIAELIKLSL